MKRILSLTVLFLVLSLTKGSAQSYFTGTEYGLAVGASEYFGDLNDNYGFKYVRPAGGGFIRFHANPYISVRLAANYTQIGYQDNWSNNPYNKKRNLSFRSNIAEGLIQAEFNFFRFSTGEIHSRFTPYLTLGVGAFYYNPYAEYNGRKYELRPIATEGKRYSNFSMCFPIGMGIKYWIAPGVNLGFEIADRLTVTDYIDDVSKTYIGANKFPQDPQNPDPAYILQDRSVEISNEPLGRVGKQRGNSASRDQYLMCLFNISFQFKTYRCPSYMKEGYYLY